MSEGNVITRAVTWIAMRGASRKRTLVDRICRRILDRLVKLQPEKDFMRDEWIDSDVGYDPDELERYSRGGSTG